MKQKNQRRFTDLWATYVPGVPIEGGAVSSCPVFFDGGITWIVHVDTTTKVTTVEICTWFALAPEDLTHFLRITLPFFFFVVYKVP